MAAARGRRADTQHLLDEAYRQWADLAEVELADRSGQPPKKFGERGRLPRFVWRSVLPEVTPRIDRPYAAAAAWISAVLGELGRINRAVRVTPNGGEVADQVGVDPPDAGWPRRRCTRSSTGSRGQKSEGQAAADGTDRLRQHLAGDH